MQVEAATYFCAIKRDGVMEKIFNLTEFEKRQLALSIAEVVQASGLCRTLVYAEIRSGRLLARKCGRRTVILREDLEAFLRALPCATPAR
jgi:Helix-turn-helix domain